VPRILEFDYFITPAPENLAVNLHDAEVLFVLSSTGHGMPPLEYITERGPLQHGESLLDFRLRPRIITMVTRQQFACRDEYWDGRNALVDAIRPNRQAIGQFNPGRLRKVLPDGSMRDIYVMIESGPGFAPRELDRWDELAFNEALRFVAYDPVFFDPRQNRVLMMLVTEDNLIFYEAPAHTDRLVFPIWFTGPIVVIDYVGSWLAYPTILVTGPADNLIINNVTTDEKLDLSAYSIAPGEVVTFTTEYGRKSVVNQLGVNLLPYLSSDSDLATFHLEPDPGAPGGVNQIQVFLTNETAASAIEVQWYSRYIGF
jgi:hypothetical protein